MLLLISTGLRQLKNYFYHHKAILIISIISAIFLIGYMATVIILDLDVSGFGDIAPLEIYPCAVVLSVLVTLFSFLQADYMQISEGEANIFFTSPIKEHKILLYIFIKNSYQVAIMLIAFLQLNIRIIRPLFGLGSYDTLRLFIWEGCLFSTLIMFGLFLTIVKKKSSVIFYSTCFVLLSITVAIALIFAIGAYSTGDLPGEFNEFFAGRLWVYFPVAGILAKASGFITQPSLVNTMYLLIVVGLNIIFILSPYYIKVSMGEAAVEAAVKTKIRREKKRTRNISGFKIEKQAGSSKEIKFSGAWAIIDKQLIEYIRNSRFFISGNTLFILMLMAIYIGILKMFEYGIFGQIPADQLEEVLITLCYTFIAIIAIMGIMITSSLPRDISNPIILLLPDKAFKKIAAMSFVINLENFIKAALMLGFIYLSGVDLALGICLAILYFLVISTSAYIDIFAYSIFSRMELGFIKHIFAGFAKSFVLFIYLGVYMAVALLTTGEGLNFVSITGLIVTGVIALLVDFGLVNLTSGF